MMRKMIITGAMLMGLAACGSPTVATQSLSGEPPIGAITTQPAPSTTQAAEPTKLCTIPKRKGDTVQCSTIAPTATPGADQRGGRGAPAPSGAKATTTAPRATQAAPKSTTAPQPTQKPAQVTYANCTDVWNRLGRPIGKGDPGYTAGKRADGSYNLDGNSDGIGCETDPRGH